MRKGSQVEVVSWMVLVLGGRHSLIIHKVGYLLKEREMVTLDSSRRGGAGASVADKIKLVSASIALAILTFHLVRGFFALSFSLA